MAISQEEAAQYENQFIEIAQSMSKSYANRFYFLHIDPELMTNELYVNAWPEFVRSYDSSRGNAENFMRVLLSSRSKDFINELSTAQESFERGLSGNTPVDLSELEIPATKTGFDDLETQMTLDRVGDIIEEAPDAVEVWGMPVKLNDELKDKLREVVHWLWFEHGEGPLVGRGRGEQKEFSRFLDGIEFPSIRGLSPPESALDLLKSIPGLRNELNELALE